MTLLSIARRRAAALADDDGFVLIEAVIAAFILILAAVAIFDAYDASTSATFRAQQSQVELSRAQQEMERIRALSYPEIALTKPPEPEQQVDDKHHHEVLRPVRRSATIDHRSGEPLFEPQPLEQRLEDHEPGERGEPLVFEPKLRDCVDGRDNLWSAQSHGSGPLRVVVGVFTTSFYTTKRPYFYASHRRETADRMFLDPSASRRRAQNPVPVTQLAGSASPPDKPDDIADVWLAHSFPAFFDSCELLIHAACPGFGPFPTLHPIDSAKFSGLQ